MPPATRYRDVLVLADLRRPRWRWLGLGRAVRRLARSGYTVAVAPWDPGRGWRRHAGRLVRLPWRSERSGVLVAGERTRAQAVVVWDRSCLARTPPEPVVLQADVVVLACAGSWLGRSGPAPGDLATAARGVLGPEVRWDTGRRTRRWVERHRYRPPDAAWLAPGATVAGRVAATLGEPARHRHLLNPLAAAAHGRFAWPPPGALGAGRDEPEADATDATDDDAGDTDDVEAAAEAADPGGGGEQAGRDAVRARRGIEPGAPVVAVVAPGGQLARVVPDVVAWARSKVPEVQVVVVDRRGGCLTAGLDGTAIRRIDEPEGCRRAFDAVVVEASDPWARELDAVSPACVRVGTGPGAAPDAIAELDRCWTGSRPSEGVPT